MADVIVTTPRSQMGNAAKEAEDAKKYGGETLYFRRFGTWVNLKRGDRIYYVEDGFVRGFAVVERFDYYPEGRECDTTGTWYDPGYYAFMRADSWQWLQPVGMVGFQGFRYAQPEGVRLGDFRREHVTPPYRTYGQSDIVIIGDWLAPKPETPSVPESTSRTTAQPALL